MVRGFVSQEERGKQGDEQPGKERLNEDVGDVDQAFWQSRCKRGTAATCAAVLAGSPDWILWIWAAQ